MKLTMNERSFSSLVKLIKISLESQFTNFLLTFQISIDSLQLLFRSFIELIFPRIFLKDGGTGSSGNHKGGLENERLGKSEIRGQSNPCSCQPVPLPCRKSFSLSTTSHPMSRKRDKNAAWGSHFLTCRATFTQPIISRYRSAHIWNLSLGCNIIYVELGGSNEW